jgi:hypothetical protein
MEANIITGHQEFIQKFIGKQFGQLTVQEYVLGAPPEQCRSFWRVRCSCGVSKVLMKGNLEKTKSCGCLLGKNALDLIGQKFKRLTVEKREGSNSFGDSTWFCVCDCGKTKIVSGRSLVRGSTGSCGCLSDIPSEEVAVAQLYSQYGRQASLRGLSWELKRSDFARLILGACFYCGDSGSDKLVFNRKTREPFLHNGIDRLNNDSGYVIENVVSCCKFCNFAKRERSLTEFRQWIEHLVCHQAKKIMTSASKIEE